jgi:hypothetical protein
MAAPNKEIETFDESAALIMLQCLCETAKEVIETKRRLGQYWVVSTPDGPRFEGPGAPS